MTDVTFDVVVTAWPGAVIQFAELPILAGREDRPRQYDLTVREDTVYAHGVRIFFDRAQLELMRDQLNAMFPTRAEVTA